MRDQYEKTLWRLIEATESGSLEWRAVAPHAYGEVLTNPDRVIRAFVGDLQLAEGKSYPVLTVERKGLVHDDVSREFDRIECEVYVLNDRHGLIFPIYEGLADRDDLFRLFAAVAESSDQAREFFGALDATG